MRRILSVIVGCACLSAVGMGGEAQQAVPVVQGKGDLEFLQGTWRAVHRIREGKQTPSEVKLVITGDRFVVTRPDGTERQGTFKLGMKETFKTLDLMYGDPDERGKIGRAIYELDGDTLKTYGTSTLDSDRPTPFESEEGDGKVTEVFRRVKAPDEGAKGEDTGRQKLLDELDEVRVREEVLKWQRDADRTHLQQQVQTARMYRASVGMGGGFGEGGERLTEEQRKEALEQQKQQQQEAVEQAERSQKEAESEYLKTSKELARITRTRAELERRVGDKPASKPKADGALDQIEKVAGIVRQVQDEVARFRQAEPAQQSQGGWGFIRVGNHLINPDRITHVEILKDEARVFFGGGERLDLDKMKFKELEGRLTIRDR